MLMDDLLSGTLLSGIVCTATTDEEVRRWFRGYWTLDVGSGARVLVNGALDVTREMEPRDKEQKALCA
jgi:hypothetical protein